MSDKNEGGLEKSLQQDFGGVVFEYRDDQAIADGVLIPLMANKRDTDHRMTSNAFETLKGHHRQRGYANYGDAEFYKFFFAEMIPGDDTIGAVRQA